MFCKYHVPTWNSTMAPRFYASMILVWRWSSPLSLNSFSELVGNCEGHSRLLVHRLGKWMPSVSKRMRYTQWAITHPQNHMRICFTWVVLLYHFFIEFLTLSLIKMPATARSPWFQTIHATRRKVSFAALGGSWRSGLGVFSCGIVWFQKIWALSNIYIYIVYI